jgi:hypothetical protein
MLEQAIVDAQALREAALKNAEQALIEKFTPQIKEAVESLLEGDIAEKRHKRVSYEGQNYDLMELDGGKATIQQEGGKAFIVQESELGEELDEELLQEEEGDMAGGAAPAAASLSAPFAGSPVVDPNQTVEFSVDVEEPVYEFDLEALKSELDGEEPTDEELPGPDALLNDLDVGGDEELDLGDEDEEEGGLPDLELQEEKGEEDDIIKEIMNLMNEMDDGKEDKVLEEELIVDMDHVKDGTFQTHKETLEYYEDMRKAKEESSELKEENEDLKETIKRFKHKNKQYKDVVEKLSQKLNETLLSNAKLLYSNKTLSDASLNERQKTKIVEAIAKSRTPEEAKHLCETLNATVTSSRDKKSPRTLSESVQRKSNLSGILNTRKQRVNESVEHTFADKMKKLAGIK